MHDDEWDEGPSDPSPTRSGEEPVNVDDWDGSSAEDSGPAADGRRRGRTTRLAVAGGIVIGIVALVGVIAGRPQPATAPTPSIPLASGQAVPSATTSLSPAAVASAKASPIPGGSAATVI